MPDEREPPAPKNTPGPSKEPTVEPEVSPEEVAARKRELDSRYEMLYARCYDLIVVYLVRMNFSRDKARELAQETFLRVYQGMERFRGTTEASEFVFLKETARNVGLNEIRRRLTIMRAAPEVPVSPDVENVLSDTSPSEEEQLVEREATTCRRKWLRDAIQRLPHLDKVCLLLWLKGDSYDQIHRALHITELGVKARLRDIRKRLRKMLGEEPTGINWPGGRP